LLQVISRSFRFALRFVQHPFHNSTTRRRLGSASRRNAAGSRARPLSSGPRSKGAVSRCSAVSPTRRSHSPLSNIALTLSAVTRRRPSILTVLNVPSLILRSIVLRLTPSLRASSGIGYARRPSRSSTGKPLIGSRTGPATSSLCNARGGAAHSSGSLFLSLTPG
jgi:hypothetical protein